MNYEITKTDQLKRGDLVLFKGNGFLFTTLSFLLCLFDSDWRKYSPKPWHCAFVSRVIGESEPSYMIAEAWNPKVRERLFEPSIEDCKIYRWLDREQTSTQIESFLAQTMGARYDISIYFLTSLQYLARHLWNRPILRLLDNRFSCWEVDCDAMLIFGRGLMSMYDCPMMPDMLRGLGVLPPYKKGLEKVLSIVTERGTR